METYLVDVEKTYIAERIFEVYDYLKQYIYIYLK